MVHLYGTRLARIVLCISTLASYSRYGTSLLSGFPLGGLHRRASSCSCSPRLLSCGIGNVAGFSRLGVLRGGAQDAEVFVAANSDELRSGDLDSDGGGSGNEVVDTDAIDTKKQEKWLLWASEHDR